MGVFNQTIRLGSMDGQRSLEVEALVDTGASYTIVPGSVLEGLGVQPIDRIALTLADGRRVECDIGEAVAAIDGRTAPTLVAFGEDGAHSLLGAYTLEGLRLTVDPIHGKLVPLTTAWA